MGYFLALSVVCRGTAVHFNDVIARANQRVCSLLSPPPYKVKDILSTPKNSLKGFSFNDHIAPVCVHFCPNLTGSLRE